MAERRATLVALCVAALVGGGCFGGDDPPASSSSEPITISTPMTIYVPRPDARPIRARVSLTDSLRTNVTVRGRTEPDVSVSVSSGCAIDACGEVVVAAIDGQWEARVRVMVPRDEPTATITAINKADPTDRATAEIRLYGPKPKATPTPTPKPKKPGGTPPPATTPSPTRAPTAPRSLVMIGDSLAVGTEPYLSGLLPGWSVRTNAEKSRPLSAGMQILGGTDLGGGPVVLAFSLFTNDSPSNVSALESAVRTSLSRAGPNGCAVWATIVRPPVGGVSYAAANRRLNELAADPSVGRRLRVVPWADLVRSNPGLVAGDGVHATAEGYRARAQMYADAARSCGS